MNSKNILTICITSYNDRGFILNTLYCLEKLTKHPYKVIIRDNNSKPRFYNELKLHIKKYNNVFLYRVENFNLTGSLAHGTALNDMARRVNTPYFCILDADATWLIKDWDEILINQLDDKTKIIGSQASGDKPKDFPLMFAVLLETETFKKLNIDFRPRDLGRHQDTGWELREKYLSAEFYGKIIEMKNTRVYKNGPFKNLLGISEYYLYGYKHIFASHFGRGSSMGNSKYKKGTPLTYNLPIIGKLLRASMGKREIQLWIKICKSIVKKQTL